MFGYVLPEKPEMKVKEYELFKAYYCGVCKAIGRRCGQLPRLALNFDSTFLAVLLSSAAGEKPLIRRETCIAHPVKKRPVVLNSTMVDYASDINIILAYYKMKDDWNDERSLVSGAAMKALQPVFSSLEKKHPELCSRIKSRLDELSSLEKEGCSSMDRAAEPFAQLMRELLVSAPLPDKETAEIAGWIGYNLGKWIYILDAFDDLEDNIKTKAYNPLLCQFGSSGSLEELKERIRPKVEFNLIQALHQMGTAFELMKKNGSSGIIENIIYMGMLRKTENILGIGSCKKVDESV